MLIPVTSNDHLIIQSLRILGDNTMNYCRHKEKSLLTRGGGGDSESALYS